MKISSLLGALLLLLCSANLTGCDKDDDKTNLFPEGTASLRMMNEDNGKTLLGNSDVYITKEGNFRSGQFPIFDMGKKGGIGDISMPNFINMAPEVAVQPKHGYVICDADDVYTFSASQQKAIAENAQVYRIYVDSWIKDGENNIGANVHFLLGRPADNYLPAWNSVAGTAYLWDKDYENHIPVNIKLPSSDPKDIDVEFTDQDAENYLSYSLSKNVLSIQLNGLDNEGGEYRVRIRCKHIYTEVRIIAEFQE